MTYKQIVQWCLSEIAKLNGNRNNEARRVAMLMKVKNEAENRIGWGLL